MTGDVVAVIVCLFGSAFFSSSETALSSLPLTRLEALRERHGRLTRKGLDRWSESPQQLLITILIGNNLVNVLASALATKLAYRLSSDFGLSLAVGLMTVAILVFGEITPKTLAQTHAQRLAVRVVPVLYVLDVAARPVNVLLGGLTKLLLRDRRAEAPVTEQDIVLMLRLAHHHAQLTRDERRMLESVLEFHDATAREVMVPRPHVVTLDTSWDLDTVRATVTAAGHSRYPVVDGAPDKIVGLIHAKQLLSLPVDADWTDLVSAPMLIPPSKLLADLLKEFRQLGQHMAIVLDEFGGFAGIVTMEDGVELVVGEIHDEFDQDRPDRIELVDGGWLVPAHLPLRRLERLTERDLSQERFESIGGLVDSMIQGTLLIGATVVIDGLIVEVVEVDDNRPSRLKVQRRAPSSPAP